ncbi:unnamed protein product [Gulo gulo]|uniref:Uncharacterized protein n=1 Tax=Gulo gulo TaxID=48420 RepID=A0A9X9PZ92_GULGU|nr:unnamed protein product [Gulo gulo]
MDMLLSPRASERLLPPAPWLPSSLFSSRAKTLGQAGSSAALQCPWSPSCTYSAGQGLQGPPCCLIFLLLSQHPALSVTPLGSIFFGRQDATSCGCPPTSPATHLLPRPWKVCHLGKQFCQLHRAVCRGCWERKGHSH